MKRLLLLPLLFLALAPAAARADELSDWQPVVQELFAAVKARNSGEEWNLPKMRARYEKIVHDLKAYQAAYPHPQHGDDLTDLITAMQRNADLLTWEQAGQSPQDPHGMAALTAQLKARFQMAQAAEAAGRWKEARDTYQACCTYWSMVAEMHPGWHPAFVAQQVRTCLDHYSAAFQKIWWEDNPYFDHKFHTPLSV